MKLEQAIKSGKKFKRKGNLGWIDLTDLVAPKPIFSVSEILADYWTIEEEKKLLSREDVERAIDEAEHPHHLIKSHADWKKAFLKELGFSEEEK